MPALFAALDTLDIDELATSIAEMLTADDHTAVMRLRSGSDEPFWIDTPYGRHAVRLTLMRMAFSTCSSNSSCLTTV